MRSIPRFVGVLSGILFALSAMQSGCQSTTGKTAGQTMSDASISTAVQTKLTRDRLSSFTRVDVDTVRGVVNLSGVVETEEQRAQAERLAHQVNGVVRVNNHLQIQHRLPAGQSTKPPAPPAMKAVQPKDERGHADKNVILQSQGVSTMEGEVVRVDGDHYWVRDSDGKEISLHADTTTMKTERIKQGDRVAAKFDENNHALSLLPAPEN